MMDGLLWLVSPAMHSRQTGTHPDLGPGTGQVVAGSQGQGNHLQPPSPNLTQRGCILKDSARTREGFLTAAGAFSAMTGG